MLPKLILQAIEKTVFDIPRDITVSDTRRGFGRDGWSLGGKVDLALPGEANLSGFIFTPERYFAQGL